MKPSASSAIKILAKIHEVGGSSMVAYWVAPNVILTLSGARGFCDGVFWSQNQNQNQLTAWDKDIKQSIELIKSCCPVLVASSDIRTVRGDQTFASFDLILEDGLRAALRQTRLLGKELPDLSKTKANPSVAQEEIVKNLRTNSEFKKYSSENINHMAFGIMLGYPDKAILGSVESWESANGGDELIDATIDSSDYYTCPQPAYAYPPSLAKDADIIAHEQAWSHILSDYYQSDFHKLLEADSGFQVKIKELGMVEV